MPRLGPGPEYRAFMGVGSTVPSVDGRAFPGLLGGWSGREREGSHCWLSADEVVFQDTSTGVARVVALDVRTGSVRVLTVRPATQVVADGGVWAVWDDTLGYADSFGRPRPAGVPVTGDWFPADAQGGMIVVFPVYHSYVQPRILWDGRGDRGHAPPRMSWECGHVDGLGLCAWPYGDKTSGIMLSQDGLADYRPDIAVDGDRIIVVSSVGASEQAHELRRYVVNQRRGTLLRSWFEPNHNGGLTEVFETSPLARVDLTHPRWTDPDPSCDVPTFAPATHPIRVEVFGDKGFNLSLDDSRHDDPGVKPWGVFFTMGRDDADRLQLRAESLGVPLFAYTDSDTFNVVEAERLTDQCAESVIGSVQFYPSGKHQRILDSIGLATHTTDSVAIVAAAYRQIRGDGTYAWTLPQVLARLSLAWERAHADPRISHFLIFHQNRADGRDGVVSRPEFSEAVRRIKAAAAAYRPSAPTVPPVPGTGPSVSAPDPAPVPHLLEDMTIMAETELFRGLVRGGMMLSVEPAAHSGGSTDIVRWVDGPLEVSEWTRIRVHAPDPAHPQVLALDVVAAGKRVAYGDDGHIYLYLQDAWGHEEQFIGGRWPDGRECVMRATPVPIGDEVLVLVK